MKTTIKAIKRGIKAAVEHPQPRKFQAAGKTVVCSHCGGRDWVPYSLGKWVAEGLLYQPYGLECSACGHIQFFAKEPEIGSGV